MMERERITRWGPLPEESRGEEGVGREGEGRDAVLVEIFSSETGAAVTRSSTDIFSL